jgi:hypothetical protein
MWGHRVTWLLRQGGGSGTFGTGPPYSPVLTLVLIDTYINEVT